MRAMDPATRAPLANLLYDIQGARAYHQGEVSDPGRVGVHASDALTLIVELEEPTGYFLHLLANPVTFPVPRHAVEALGDAWTEVENIVTNGPFRLEAWQPGASMVLSRDPAYHGRFSGNLLRVELSLFPFDAGAAALKMYEADQLDILPSWRLSPQEFDHARQQHAGEYKSGPGLSTYFVGFDVRRPPFDDPRVRRAFVLATDREALAGVVLRGQFAPATGGFIPPGMPGHSSGIALPYDPLQARQLLAEAGYSPFGAGGRGFPVVDVDTHHLLTPWLDYMETQWREILGVEINTWAAMDWKAYFDRLKQEPPHMQLTAWLADYPDPDNFLRVCVQSQVPDWRNETYKKSVEAARRLLNQEERMALYRQADMILVEERVIMPLVYGRWHLLIKPWVSKFPASPMTRWLWKEVIIEPH
jgi:oligopeptide transport system substrate-binding protein